MDITIPLLQTNSLRIKEITLWRREITTQPTAMAEAIRPLTTNGIELEVLLRYRHPTDKDRAFIEVCPQSPYTVEHVSTVLQSAGFTPRNIPALLIESEDFLERRYPLAQMIASVDVNIMFLATQTSEGKSGATIGFETATDAKKAVDFFRRMTTAAREVDGWQESSNY